jgi:beta-lactamase regulating signal transducer with metallopeptidase domain
MSWTSSFANALGENVLLERLCFASFELLVLSLLLAAIVRWARFSSLRLVALLWLIVLLKPVVTLAVGSPIAVLRLEAPTALVSQSARTSAPTPLSVPASYGNPLDFPFPTETNPDAPTSAQARTQSSSDSARARTWFEQHPLRLELLLLAAWVLGVAVCSVRYLLVRRRLLHLVARADRAPEPLEQEYARVARELGVKRMPALRVTDDLDSPALIGILRPVVMLPRWLVERGRCAPAEWALRHELAHWRWLDPLAIFVRDVVAILFFFHPTVRWAARRHAEAMEMACDWESLRDPSEAPDYAEGLCGILSLINSRQTGRANAGALAMATHGRMIRRIAALLDGRRARPLTPRSIFVTGLVALLVFAIGCGRSGSEEQAKEQSAPLAPQNEESNGERARRDATKGTEKTVLDGLRWLVRHQNPDGSWSPSTLKERCACEDPIYNPKTPYTKDLDEGLTGMALLCFLSAGFSDQSQQDIVDTATGKRYKIGEVVKNGLEWLVARQNAAGSFSAKRAFMYNEALACMALTEAFHLTQSSEWKEPAQKSLDFIAGAQRPSPFDDNCLWGWRYAARQELERFNRGGAEDPNFKRELVDSDMSITGWCMMALNSGIRSGLTVGKAHIDGGVAFARWVTADNGLVGYIDPKGAGATVTGPNDHYVYHPAVMSALGMCVRIFSAHDRADPFLDLGAQQIVKDLPTVSKDKLSIDYYYWHYASLALNQLDGPDAPKRTNKYWGPWNQAMVDAVLALQDHTERDCKNGGWMVPDRWSYGGGPLYTTALNVLTLEVYYRYENAFK